MKHFRKIFSFLLLVLLVAAPLAAKGYSIPAADYVVDQANIISSSDENALKAYLSSLYDKTGVQICVLTLKSLNGASLEDYSLAVAENWGIGKKGTDSGALLLVSMNEHAMRIEVGYGLEGSLTDAKSGLIIRRVLTPYFKDGKYSTGIVAGVEAMAQAAAGEAAGTVSGASKTNRNYSISVEDDDSEDLADVIIFLAIVFIVFMRIVSSARYASRYRGYGYGRRHNDSIWRDLFWLSMLNNNHHGGHSNHSSGLGGGGFSGGGFHGGGGHFGGGGASGHW